MPTRLSRISSNLLSILAPKSTGQRQLALGSVVAGALILALGVAVLAGQAPATRGAAPATHLVVSIPAGRAVFAPFIVTAQPHASVTWTNADSGAHTITTTPDHSAYLNPIALSLDVAPGKSVHFTFTAPGVYDYYDSGAAMWNGDEHRVTAKPGTRDFPLAMEGVIYVPGHIGGVPDSATNPIPGKDEFASDFIAIRQGGSLAWYNADTDKHEIAQVSGWGTASTPGVNPAATPAALLDGTDDAPPNGATTLTTYPMPGLYYYYCSIHATVDASWHRAVAIKDASEYPIPMEAFVLVVPS